MIKILALACMLHFAAAPALAGDLQYARLAPIPQYLMNRQSEIALARRAAPSAISDNATILVLGQHAYQTAVRGTNGWVCLVNRGWGGPIDWVEMWNPRIRAPECLNPPAVKSILPITEIKTKMVMAGFSKDQILGALRTSLQKGRLPALEPGAMSFMMAKGSYLTDKMNSNGPHLMFYISLENPTAWSAFSKNSPVGYSSY